MDEAQEKPIWSRQPGESPKAYAKFLYYRGLNGARRSLLASYVSYINSTKKTPEIEVQRDKVTGNGDKSRKITHFSKTWGNLAERFNWQARAEAYDEHLREEQEARRVALEEFEAAEAERILSMSYALKHRRVEELVSVIQTIKQSFLDSKGEVNYAWVTPDKIRELRGCLDDIAKEVGERVKKSEHTGKDGGPISLDIITEWGGGALDGAEDGG